MPDQLATEKQLAFLKQLTGKDYSEFNLTSKEASRKIEEATAKKGEPKREKDEAKSETSPPGGYKADPDKMTSIEAQNAYSGLVTLIAAGKVELNSREGQTALNYAMSKLSRWASQGEVRKQPPIKQEIADKMEEYLTDPPPEATESISSPVEDDEGTLDWIKERIGILQSMKLKAWTNANILIHLNKITGLEAKTPTEAISQLNEEQLEYFKKWIQDAIEVSGI